MSPINRLPCSLQLAGIRFEKLAFEPLPSAACAPNALDQPAAAQPGSLLIRGLLMRSASNAAGGGGQVQAATAQPPPSLNSLLEAALPPRCTLRHLELSFCGLNGVSLQRLPAIARLETLIVRQCWTKGGMACPAGWDADALLLWCCLLLHNSV